MDRETTTIPPDRSIWITPDGWPDLRTERHSEYSQCQVDLGSERTALIYSVQVQSKR